MEDTRHARKVLTGFNPTKRTHLGLTVGMNCSGTCEVIVTVTQLMCSGQPFLDIWASFLVARMPETPCHRALHSQDSQASKRPVR
mmetsp:Transcript_22140/g.39784  ORF Transcript_22140/g.39784 Transcript_22140/m.39784 type:complete len:85 (+) Transcript_22140:553-807(+)